METITKIITAQEAKVISDNGGKTLFNRCMERIEKAAAVGARKVRLWTDQTEKEDTIVLNEVIDRLKEVGYTTNIEWENIKEYSLTINW